VFHLRLAIKHLLSRCTQSIRQRLFCWTDPSRSSFLLSTVADLARSKSELVAENALLRQQFIILHRQVKRPACTKMDRLLLLLLARTVRSWKQVLFIVQPGTLLRWHRQAFRWFWRRRSKRVATKKPKIADEMVALIKTMALNNRLWGCGGTDEVLLSREK
jgi:putative transposase